MSEYHVTAGDIGTVILLSRNNGNIFFALSLLFIITHAVRSNLLNLLFQDGCDTTIRSGGGTVQGS